MKIPKAFADEKKKYIHAIIETPKGSHNKYVFDKTIKDMGADRLNDITHFFENYNAMNGGECRVKAFTSPEKAIVL